MTKRLIATVLAASVALTTAFTAPARAADSGEIGRFLLGAGTLFIIGSALSNQNRDRDRVVTRRYVEPRYVEPEYKHKHHHWVVPLACMRVNDYYEGPRRYFTQHCLRDHMRRADALPGACRTSVWDRHGRTTVYSARCLRDYGWTFG